MIRAFYGIDANPFRPDGIELLNHQQEVFDIIKVHSHQGGLCLLMGEPGTGKTSIKNAINLNAEKTTIVVNIARTLHTYCNTIRMLCHAFNVENNGSDFKCEKRLIEEAFNLNNHGKSIIVIIDDAHLMDKTLQIEPWAADCRCAHCRNRNFQGRQPRQQKPAGLQIYRRAAPAALPDTITIKPYRFRKGLDRI